MRPWQLISVVLASMLSLTVARAATRPPNVIVVLADDLGYGDLGAHGNPRLKTPNLDSLRQQSVRFTDFHVAPMCTPSRGELMTGRDAFRNGAAAVASGGSAIRRDLSLMPQFFKDNGYATAHFGKWHLGDDYPYRPQDRGFDTSLGYKGFGIDSIAGEWENDAFDDRYWRDGVLARLPGYNTDVFFNEAMAWMGRQQRRGQPFFVYLATTASHEPFYVDSRYQKPYEDLGLVLSAFYGMTANLDENMGRLLDYFRRSGMADNTILVYVTDNGTIERTGFYNAGMRGRKNSLYDGGHRVPFFLRWSGGGLGPPRDVDALAHGTDLLPTLIDLAGLRTQRATDFDGLSLAPLLRGQPDPQPERKFVIQYGLDGPVFNDWEAAVLWKKWRLVKGRELYDTGADPAQQADLAVERPEIVATLRAFYQQWLAATKPLLGVATPVVVGAQAQPVTLLTSADWIGPWAGDFKELGRTTANLFGHWPVEAAVNGRYELAFYMFPPEANTELDQSLRNIPARPVSAAQLLVDGQPVATASASKGSTHIVFTQDWRAGELHQIEGRFLDASGQPLCGAFFVRLRRMP